MGAFGSPEHLDYIKYNSPLNKCPVCKLEYRGTICPKCGTPAGPSARQTKQKAKTPIHEKGWFWAIVAVVVFFIFQPHNVSPTQAAPRQSSMSVQSPSVSTSQLESTSATISLAEYNQLQDGMSYSQVTEIIGSDGIVDYQTDMDDMHLITYHWDGNDEYSAAYVEFENDKLIGKTQGGLK